jgi:hypothetical protein
VGHGPLPPYFLSNVDVRLDAASDNR